MKNMKNIQQFENFLTESLITESMGGRLEGVLLDLEDITDSLKNSSQRITDSDVKILKAGIAELRGKFKKALKGKGIIGW